MQVLLWAQIRGNNQGLAKIAAGAVNKPETRGPVEKTQQSQGVQVWDGNNGYGMVVLQKATIQAIDVCKQNGAAAIGTNNTCTSTGALG